MFGCLFWRKKASNSAASQEYSQFGSHENVLKVTSAQQKLLREGANHPDYKDLTVLDEIDIIKDLGAIIYKAKFDNKLCNFKKIKENIQIRFERLKCKQSNCYKTATILINNDNHNPAILYWQNHFYKVSDPKKELNLVHLLFDQIGILNKLERLLVVVQYEMQYLENIPDKFDQNEFKLHKEKVEEKQVILTNHLNTMAEMSEKNICNKKGNENFDDTESLHSFKNYSDFWYETVVEFLKFIYEKNLEHKVESEVNMILKLNEDLSQSEYEKNNKYISIPDEAYGKQIVLWTIPTQRLDSIKNVYNKLQSVTKNAIDNQKVISIKVIKN